MASPTPDWQFWWNWWTNLGVALGTLLAVFAALFGEVLRSKLFPPRLKLGLLRKEGEKTRQADGLPVRYYHVHVSNERRWSVAKNVQVHLMRVEEPGPNRELRVRWNGNAPLRWRHQEIEPLLQTMGAPRDCDFCRVGKTGGLFLMPVIRPNNLKDHYAGQCLLVAWLQARSDLADSEILRIEISWDGLWEDGEIEMQGHLVVRELDR